ncbi:MAG TPA: hypothetical protein VFX15_08780 [Actinomycetes bacterium]|nr:hypothetical protein [Actinomycetes bacterium]
MSATDAPRYWWCLEHERVESDDGCRNAVRLGPFESYADAEKALELAHKRTEEWDNDDKWNGGGSD